MPAQNISVPYRGRFAPSPTGPLHFGSLLTAVGSYLEARARGGEWLLRIEDVDTQRCLPGAADHILRTLAGFGFEWDGEVLMQSQRTALYHAALTHLQNQKLAYPCTCSRSCLAAITTQRSIDGCLRYPGTCRHGLAPGVLRTPAWRLRVPDREIAFTDRIQGRYRQNLVFYQISCIIRASFAGHDSQASAGESPSWSRHRILIPAFEGSNPSSPAIRFSCKPGGLSCPFCF